ncbi:MAG: hypothetical protein D3904_01735 [Candidatus Electrothrix sp. EH2]|nr:hypothetical protein [Candidatus Electrothrix sp. EH2]
MFYFTHREKREYKILAAYRSAAFAAANSLLLTLHSKKRSSKETDRSNSVDNIPLSRKNFKLIHGAKERRFE